MKKRVLSYLGVICMCLHILSGTVFADVINSTGNNAFPDVPANAEYAEAVNALHECGIINGDEKGNFNPDKPITRAETAAIMCRFMGVGEEAKDKTTTPFTDVPSSHWAKGYIARVNELGIMNGYGNKEFGPDDEITYAQIITMLVLKLGAEQQALNAGGYPSGYITVAENLGVTKCILFQSDALAPKSAVAHLIYNCIN